MGNRYTVHSRHEASINVRAKDAEGNALIAQKKMLIVELIPLNHQGGVINELVPIKDGEMFEPGAVVEHQGWKRVAAIAAP